jgi:hypothetical protein
VLDPILVADHSNGYVQLSKSQDKEDVTLYENWFYGKKEGLIVESGACKGIILSLSYMFEKYAKWNTINVEADPNSYELLTENRKDAINIFSALCSESGLLHYTDSIGAAPEVRGIVEFMSDSFIKRWMPDVASGKTPLEDLAKMRCLTVKNLFRMLAVKHVDIWILDLEGAEENALLGTDFQEVQIDVVVMECEALDREQDERKINILEKNGFRCTHIYRNCFCKHDSYEPSTMDEKYHTTPYHWTGSSWKGV